MVFDAGKHHLAVSGDGHFCLAAGSLRDRRKCSIQREAEDVHAIAVAKRQDQCVGRAAPRRVPLHPRGLAESLITFLGAAWYFEQRASLPGRNKNSIVVLTTANERQPLPVGRPPRR